MERMCRKSEVWRSQFLSKGWHLDGFRQCSLVTIFFGISVQWILKLPEGASEVGISMRLTA